MKIAIIGAGIGGLALALALRERGLEATVFEQASRLTEIGAAIALSANGTRELRRLGLLDDLLALAIEPTELIYRDGMTGDRLAAHPMSLEHAYQDRFGAPYLGIHRADLQKVMGAAVGVETIALDHRLTRIEESADGVMLHFTDRDPVFADVVVGADGVRSMVRDHVTGGRQAVYSGTSAYRGIVPTSRLSALPDPQAIQFWIGENAHMLHYAIGPEGGDVNFFAVVEGPTTWPSETSWVVPATLAEAHAGFARWHPAIAQMLEEAAVDKRWGLFVTPPLRQWHKGPAVLIGDAAHAMLPHHGQGANTSIEDACILAGMLEDLTPLNREERFARYEALRRLRTRKIQRSAWDANAALHTVAAGASKRRQATLARFPERFAWIHGYDARTVDGRLDPVPE
ncbi:FAD-dependent monooxygenase [Sphingomonas sp. 4RDLI-65]|uniref:FAD-dependent monooxygenase n=1 Tax=Sphingomonas sp. 4RDLI-65 TaxID=3111641 RepID=UPI003C1F188D